MVHKTMTENKASQAYIMATRLAKIDAVFQLMNNPLQSMKRSELVDLLMVLKEEHSMLPLPTCLDVTSRLWVFQLDKIRADMPVDADKADSEAVLQLVHALQIWQPSPANVRILDHKNPHFVPLAERIVEEENMSITFAEMDDERTADDEKSRDLWEAWYIVYICLLSKGVFQCFDLITQFPNYCSYRQ